MKKKWFKKRSLALSLLVIMCICLLDCSFQSKEEVVSQKVNVVLTAIDPVLVTVKYSYSNCSNYDSGGVNIYFAGLIRNHSFDTLKIPHKRDTSSYVILADSFFYTIINGDTLYFQECSPRGEVIPKSTTLIELHRYIVPGEKKWMDIFKMIKENPIVLDTLQIRYLSTTEAGRGIRVLPPITFRHSSKFRVDTTYCNSSFEDIFEYQDFFEKPVRDPLRSNVVQKIWGSDGIIPYRYIYFRFIDGID